MGKNKAQYTGLFLSDSSRVVAINAVGAPCGYVLEKVLAHHLTLKFKPTRAEVMSLPIGDTFSMEATGYGADWKAQAIYCSLGLTCTNRYPHVTVAVAAGVKPVYSNELLSKKIIYFDEPILLTGRIGYFDGQNDRFDFAGTIYED